MKKTSNIVLLSLGAFLLAFVVVMIVTFWVKDSVPDTLIEKVLDVGSWELGALALIKISKVIRGDNAAESGEEDDL